MIVMILPLLAIEVDGELFVCCSLVDCYLPQRIQAVFENSFVVDFASIDLGRILLLVHSYMMMGLGSLLGSVQTELGNKSFVGLESYD
jgi:hypothetical protein